MAQRARNGNLHCFPPPDEVEAWELWEEKELYETSSIPSLSLFSFSGCWLLLYFLSIFRNGSVPPPSLGPARLT